MKKASRSVLYALIRPILKAHKKNRWRDHHPGVDFSRFDVVGFDVKDFSDDELETAQMNLEWCAVVTQALLEAVGGSATTSI